SATSWSAPPPSTPSSRRAPATVSSVDTRCTRKDADLAPVGGAPVGPGGMAAGCLREPPRLEAWNEETEGPSRTIKEDGVQKCGRIRAARGGLAGCRLTPA